LAGTAESRGADREHLAVLDLTVLAPTTHGAAQRGEPLVEAELQVVVGRVVINRIVAGRTLAGRVAVARLALLPVLPCLLLRLGVVLDPVDDHGEGGVQQAMAHADEIVVLAGTAAVLDVGGEAGRRMLAEG